jgi:ABC-type sulfate transport system substrate-binding protein
MMQNQKETVEQIRVEWKRLWSERHEDKLRAEGIANNDYSALYIDRGTIIHATRDFKVLNFKDILKQHDIENPDRYIQPDKQIGGWNKFVKDNITKQSSSRKTTNLIAKPNNQKQPTPQKQNSRGWLHY